jgi:ankyrin repeat protein
LEALEKRNDAQQDHWTERGRAASVSNSNATDRPRRSVLSLAGITHHMENELFDICCERHPRRAEQRRQILAALKRGADIHATDKNGVTALHHAVRFRSPTL